MSSCQLAPWKWGVLGARNQQSEASARPAWPRPKLDSARSPQSDGRFGVGSRRRSWGSAQLPDWQVLAKGLAANTKEGAPCPAALPFPAPPGSVWAYLEPMLGW